MIWIWYEYDMNRYMYYVSNILELLLGIMWIYVDINIIWIEVMNLLLIFYLFLILLL